MTLLVIFSTIVGTLVYTYLGYVFVVHAVAAFARPRRPRQSSVPPRVSLVFAAHNEQDVIAAKLNNSLELNYPKDRLEILVASDGSSDETVAIARRFAGQRVVVLDLTPNRGKATAINEAIQHATGDVLCLCDANVMLRPDALQLMVDHLSESKVGAVTGDVRLVSEDSNFGEGEGLYYRLERSVQFGETKLGSTICVDGGMYVIRRELFQPIAPDTILDDFVTSIRVIQRGFRIIYEPNAVATENGTPSGSQEYRRRVRVAEGAVQTLKNRIWPPLTRPVLFWQWFSHKFLRWLGPFFLIGALVTNAIVWNASLFHQIALVSQGLFYLVAALATVSFSLRRTKVGGVAFYFTMSHIAMVHGWWRGLFRRQSGRWQRTERGTPSSVTDSVSVG